MGGLIAFFNQYNTNLFSANFYFYFLYLRNYQIQRDSFPASAEISASMFEGPALTIVALQNMGDRRKLRTWIKNYDSVAREFIPKAGRFGLNPELRERFGLTLQF